MKTRNVAAPAVVYLSAWGAFASTLFFAGDSTLDDAGYSLGGHIRAPYYSWGTQLQKSMKSDCRVANNARSGESTKSFAKSGMWAKWRVNMVGDPGHPAENVRLENVTVDSAENPDVIENVRMAARRLALYDIVPYAPGHEAETARDIRETRATAGIDTFLYCVSLDPRGRPAFDRVTAATASFRRLKAELGDAPVKLGFLLQSILGHWPRIDREIEPWQRSVDEDGNVKRFCLLDPRYRDYIRRTGAALAAERPCFILGDDDIRAFSPRLECFCPLHAAAFNRLAGTDYTPEQYRAAARACADGDRVATLCARLRDEIPMTAARLLREGIDSVDPAIPAGACMPGAETLLAAPRAKLLAGAGHPVTLRLANGQYSEMGPADFAANALLTQAYQAHYGDRIDLVLDESDSFPHTLYARSARTLVAKLAMNVFNGIRGAKLWYVGMRKQTERVPAGHARALGRAVPQLEALAAALEGSAPLGVRIPAFYRAPGLRAGEPRFFADLTWQERMLAVYGVPFHADFSRAKGAPVMLCGASTVERLPSEDLAALFGGKVFVDGPAALALAARGFGDELGCRPVADARAFNVEEVKASGARPPIAKTAQFPALTEPGVGVEVYSELKYSPTGAADPNASAVAPASLLARNARGGLTFTAAFDPSFAFNAQNLRRKAWLVGALRSLEPGFPVVCANEEPNLTLARRGRDGRNYAITLNCGYDDLDATRYWTATPMADAETLGEDGAWRPAEARKTDGAWAIPGKVPCMGYRVVRW